MAKVLELQLYYQSSNEYSGLISFKIDWFDLLAVQGTLKNLLQHQSLKASMYEDPKKRSNTALRIDEREWSL